MNQPNEVVDQLILEIWRSGPLNQEAVAARAGCSPRTVAHALERMGVSYQERRERARLCAGVARDGVRAERLERARAMVPGLYAEGLGLRAIRERLGVGAAFVVQVLGEIGVDWRSLIGRRAKGKHKPRAERVRCWRCEICLDEVTVPGLGSVTKAYDGLCFCCWFELVTGRVFDVHQTLSLKELETMAAGNGDKRWWTRMGVLALVMTSEGVAVKCPRCNRLVPVVAEDGIDVCECGAAFRVKMDWAPFGVRKEDVVEEIVVPAPVD